MNSVRLARLFWLATFLVACVHGATFSKCDVHQDGTINATDVQLMVNEALGAAPAANDLNADAVVNVLDVQIDINAALGSACLADPGLVSIIPNTGQQGTTFPVTIVGRLTNFTNSSVISLGSGVTVSGIAATNATTLTASVTIDASATASARTLTVDGFTLPNAFSVTPPISVSYSYDSQGRLVTATYRAANGTVKVVTYTYDSAGNRTAVVAQ